ncbi:testosterone 17-beta-dehydrogenase 3 isoform X2 [Polyodon spathula]|uniref:testosterone 17-beta-dehydrogenase 3 isoform X2 n=1 Tax=Polyodon spathula TaxID=7913 RepID=UPI001B7DD30E|nr:testosterone 17-beta-dehydrogenase 3 isoform X2 [Polyodon spathula]
MSFLDLILISVGAIVALVYVLKFIKLVKILFPKTWYPLSRSFFSSLGEWAVITGGTDGIGRAYAFELAKRGMNIVLISRTLEKLIKVAKEIEDDTGRSVKVIASDFTREDIYENIEDNLKGLDVGILVNNVGMLFSPMPRRFLDVENLDTGITNLINCNMKSLVMMSKIILPHMEKRKKGLILNLSSGTGCFPWPLYSIYSASKVFVDRFSRGLQSEYGYKGVTIQSIAPYGVSTPMTQNQKTNMVTKTAQDFVNESLDRVLVGDHNHGCFSHEILALIIKAIPLWVLHSNVLQEKVIDYLKNKLP